MTMSGLGLNLPNLISLARLLMVPLTIWLIFEDRYTAAFWVFIGAGLSDALDGYIAKRFDRRTRLGALLDPAADKTLLAGMYVTLGLAGQLPGWLVVLVILRDFLIILGFVVTLYTMLGGIKAVIWTEVIQFCVMLGGLAIMMGVELIKVYDRNVDEPRI